MYVTYYIQYNILWLCLLFQGCLKIRETDCRRNLKTEALTFDLESTWNSTAAAAADDNTDGDIFLFQFLSEYSSCPSHIHAHGAFTLGNL